MAYYQHGFETPAGGVINVSSTKTDWNKPVGASDFTLYDNYSIGVTEPSTTVKLKTNIPIIQHNDVAALFPTYQSMQTSEYFSSEEYKIIKARLIDSGAIQWVWGSYETGGVCYYAVSPTQIELRTVSGFYNMGEVEGVEYYSYNTAYATFTPDQASELKFSIDETRINDVTPNFFPLKVYYGGNDFAGYLFEYDVKLPATGLEMGFYPVDVLPGAFDYILGQYGTFADFPEVVPIVEDIPSYIFKVNQKLEIWDPNFPGGELISGSFYGNAEIDEEGNPFLNGDYSFPGGGWGEYPNRSDEIDTTNPENFSTDVINSGFLTLYNPTSTEIINFNKFLFSDLSDGAINQLKKLTTEPLQYLLFMAMCHFQPFTNAREEISFCGIGSGVEAAKIGKQYKQLNCGSVIVPEASKSFLDYGGFSKVSIFLPYCGIHELNIDDVMNSRIKVVYNIDQLTGACLVQVKCTRNSRSQGDTNINSVLYTFNGNCYETIPIFASDWRSAINAITGLISGAAQAAVTKDVGGLLGSLTEAVTSEKVKVNRSGSPSASYGYMDNQKPYLILERPVQNIPTNFGKLQGYTSNLYRGIGYLKGFTIVYDDTLWTQKINCSKEEADEIRRIMAGGVFL